jgi:hypothetical protein
MEALSPYPVLAIRLYEKPFWPITFITLYSKCERIIYKYGNYYQTTLYSDEQCTKAVFRLILRSTRITESGLYELTDSSKETIGPYNVICVDNGVRRNKKSLNNDTDSDRY